jgi:hypothetical protein
MSCCRSIVIDALGRQRLGKEQLPALIQILRRLGARVVLRLDNRNQRLAKDFEVTINSARAILYVVGC